MADIENRDELEREIARKLGKMLKAQLARLLELMGDPPNINNVTEEFWRESGAEFTEVVRPFLRNTYQRQAQSMLGKIPIGVEWTLINEAAATWASRYTFDLVRGINETSRRMLQSAINIYYRDAMNMGELTNMLVGSFGPVRAEMIAVTEVTRASTNGERALSDELANQGIHMVEVWRTNNDELVCEICGPRNGKPVGDGWVRDDGPPAHPRCRCWVDHEFAKVEE